MGYVLPDSGTPYTDDLDWYLVAIPADPAFRRAAMGAYTRLADVWVWGLEKAKTPEEKALQLDARRVWLNAINATWDEMSKLDDLLAAVDEVEPLLRAIRDAQCCALGGDPVPSVSGDLVIDPVGIAQDYPPLEKNDPTTWPPDLETDPTGATAFADLAALSDFLCRSAGSVFDLLLDMLWVAGIFHDLAFSINQLTQEWIQNAILRMYPTAQGAVVAFAYDQLADLLSPWAEQLDKALLDSARAELELARDQIVCAWANANNYTEAITATQAVLASVLTSTVVYTWMTSGGLVGFVVALLFRLWADPVDYTCACGSTQATGIVGARMTLLTNTGTDDFNMRLKFDGHDTDSDYALTQVTDGAISSDVAGMSNVSFASAIDQTYLDAIPSTYEKATTQWRSAGNRYKFRLGLHNYAATATRNYGGTIDLDWVVLDGGLWRAVKSITLLGGNAAASVSGTVITLPNAAVTPKNNNGVIVEVTI